MRFFTVLILGLIVSGCAGGISSHTTAEQYLCTAKSVVWTTTSEDGERITGHSYDGADSSYLFSDASGTWKARGLGDSGWHFDSCNAAGLVCESPGNEQTAPDAVFSGAISRNPLSGAFYATGVRGDASTSHVFTVAGTCAPQVVAF